MREAVIVSVARTPIGKAYRGAFNNTNGATLGGHAIAEAVKRAGIDPASIDDVSMGCALQQGTTGSNIARLAAMRAGLPVAVSGQTIDRQCSSGLMAIATAAKQVMHDGQTVAVGGGVEAISLVQNQSMRTDRLRDPWLVEHMPELYMTMIETAEIVADRYRISREAQDEYAKESFRRALSAQKDGLFDNEIVKVEIPQRKGDPVIFDTDEGVRGETTVESLAGLRPAFDKAGNITAGNASQISDGGAAVIVASKAAAEKLGVQPLGEIVGYGQVAGPDPSLLTQPSRAINAALDRAGKKVSDISLFELNEAFAAVGLASMAELGITDEITNVNGGAIALGHPVGMSGTRVALTLLLELARRGGGLGAAALCGGGGQGDAILLQTL